MGKRDSGSSGTIAHRLIMSAIDFKMDLQREPNAAGDRVNIVMSGKFLPYKTY